MARTSNFPRYELLAVGARGCHVHQHQMIRGADQPLLSYLAIYIQAQVSHTANINLGGRHILPVNLSNDQDMSLTRTLGILLFESDKLSILHFSHQHCGIFLELDIPVIIRLIYEYTHSKCPPTAAEKLCTGVQQLGVKASFRGSPTPATWRHRGYPANTNPFRAYSI